MSRRIRLSAWTRTGCYTCKRRHKKCDEQKPRCLVCTRLNLECVQSDAFCAVPAGKAPSRRKRATPQAAPFEPSPPVNSAGSRGPVPPLHDKAGEGEEECLTLSRLPSTYRPKGFHFDISQPECWLFQYYVERLSGLLVNAIGHDNPLQSLIVPRVLSSPLLLRTVCAVSALHRSSYAQDGETKYQTEATGYYVRALSDLREHVPFLHGKNNSVLLQTVLLSSIFLCKYEIIKDGVTNWRRHLKGIESFCQLLGGDGSAASIPDVMEFAQSFITYHKGIASLTEQGASAIRHDETARDAGHDASAASPSGNSVLQPVDPYMGFSKCLIVLLRQVMGLLNLNSDRRDILPIVALELQHILGLLSRRNWTAEHFLIPNGMTQETIARLEHVSRAYENAVHACLHSVIEELSAREGTQQEVWDHWDGLRGMLPVSKEAALTGCIDDIRLVPCDSPEEAGLLPVLFIVACETDSPEQMMTVLQRVTVLEAHVGLGNIRYAAALLREVWSRRMQLRQWHGWRGLLATTNWDLIIT
ncbi:fungal-specific transcription factor domain-containing protein [Coniochaeta sp. 2T2.1]|nr:fungal-specific transcription factor domain-containing protein [Coniochaeta sp. 2T2.1]